MIDLNKLYQEFQDDIDSVISWCDEVYTSKFGDYLKEGRELFLRLSSKDHQITDAELSWILIQLPVKLVSLSEAISTFKLGYEVIKLKNRQREQGLISVSLEKTASEKKRDAADKSIEDKLLAMTYTIIIDRVSSEVSFLRELVMGAKKIWDSRRKTDQSNPVGEVNLPDYVQPDKAPVYIRGGLE